jgi:hypothetical protein
VGELALLLAMAIAVQPVAGAQDEMTSRGVGIAAGYDLLLLYKLVADAQDEMTSRGIRIAAGYGLL